MLSLVIDGKWKLGFKNVPVPSYGDYQVLVKNEVCGICNGTDMKLIHGKFKGFNTYPAILGHESAGIVVEKGKKVKYMDIGDRVIESCLDEKIEDFYPGWGSFSEYTIATDWKAMMEDGMGPGTKYFQDYYYGQQVIPKDIDAITASMIITYKEVLSAMKRFGFKENESVVIIGQGPVGQTFLTFAKLLGMAPVIVADIDDKKLLNAEKLYADYIINNSSENIVEKVKNICPSGVDYIVDAVGINDLINLGMELVKFNGKICAYGISPKLGMNLDWSKAPYNWNLQFIQWPTKKEEAKALNQIVSWIRAGAFEPKMSISHIMEFSKAIEAFEVVEKKKASKVILTF